MPLEERAKEFVSKIASGTSQEMDYYANLLVEFANETTKELEQENARLKLELEALSGDIPWKDIKDKSGVIGQLTEAKDLLSRWIDDRPYTVSEQKDLIADTEQFLGK